MDLSIAGPGAGEHHKQNFNNLSYPHETAMDQKIADPERYGGKIPKMRWLTKTALVPCRLFSQSLFFRHSCVFQHKKTYLLDVRIYHQ